ncbi:MAG: DUF192 domain-containing protein [Candidatus Marinamargulisbacteria bacterium]
MIRLFNLFLLICIMGTCQTHAQNLNYLRVCVKTNCFDARVADTPATRTKGLMGEGALPDDQGMLFFFPTQGTPGFWMKRTQIPLDILFINDDDIIVYAVKNAQPCMTEDCPVYKTTRPASKVLEINGGLSNQLGIHVGDPVMYFMDDE